MWYDSSDEARGHYEHFILRLSPYLKKKEDEDDEERIASSLHFETDHKDQEDVH